MYSLCKEIDRLDQYLSALRYKCRETGMTANAVSMYLRCIRHLNSYVYFFRSTCSFIYTRYYHRYNVFDQTSKKLQIKNCNVLETSVSILARCCHGLSPPFFCSTHYVRERQPKTFRMRWRKKCTSRESNPGLYCGRVLFYH